jgi:hypothetical protein
MSTQPASEAGPSGVSANQAAMDAAMAVCSAYGRCSMFVVQRLWGTVSACTTAYTTTFTNDFAASGTGQTPAHLEACVAKAPGVACADLFANNLPTECQPPAGQLANGSPCGASSQCQSAYCNIPANVTCGACGAPPSTGGSCQQDSNCPSGNICSNDSICVAPGKAGDACTASRPCNLTLACKSGTCAQPDEAGAACTSGTCDAVAGTICSTSTDTCVAIGLADPGKPCSVASTGVTLCSSDGTCELPSSTATDGTCRAAAQPGGTCDSVNGPKCQQPAVCVNGVCTLLSAASCH